MDNSHWRTLTMSLTSSVIRTKSIPEIIRMKQIPNVENYAWTNGQPTNASRLPDLPEPLVKLIIEKHHWYIALQKHHVLEWLVDTHHYSAVADYPDRDLTNTRFRVLSHQNFPEELTSITAEIHVPFKKIEEFYLDIIELEKSGELDDSELINLNLCGACIKLPQPHTTFTKDETGKPVSAPSTPPNLAILYEGTNNCYFDIRFTTVQGNGALGGVPFDLNTIADPFTRGIFYTRLEHDPANDVYSLKHALSQPIPRVSNLITRILKQAFEQMDTVGLLQMRKDWFTFLKQFLKDPLNNGTNNTWVSPTYQNCGPCEGQGVVRVFDEARHSIDLYYPDSFDMQTWHTLALKCQEREKFFTLFDRNEFCVTEHLADATLDSNLASNIFGSCGTSHCFAGYMIHTCGDVGYALQDIFGPPTAGLMILLNSCPEYQKFGLPSFWCSTREAFFNLVWYAYLFENAAFNELLNS